MVQTAFRTCRCGVNCSRVTSSHLSPGLPAGLLSQSFSLNHLDIIHTHLDDHASCLQNVKLDSRVVGVAGHLRHLLRIWYDLLCVPCFNLYAK